MSGWQQFQPYYNSVERMWVCKARRNAHLPYIPKELTCVATTKEAVLVLIHRDMEKYSDV